MIVRQVRGVMYGAVLLALAVAGMVATAPPYTDLPLVVRGLVVVVTVVGLVSQAAFLRVALSQSSRDWEYVPPTARQAAWGSVGYGLTVMVMLGWLATTETEAVVGLPVLVLCALMVWSIVASWWAVWTYR